MKYMIMVIITIGLVIGMLTSTAYGEISKMEIYIDGIRRSTGSSTDTHSFDWSTYPEKSGWHTISAVAYNDAGSTQDAIVVLVDKRLP